MALMDVVSTSSLHAADPSIPSGEITAVSRETSGTVQLTIRDPFQGSASVEHSTDLRSWIPLATVSLDSGKANFTDPSPRPGASFYRLGSPLLDYSGDPTVSFEVPALTVPEATPFVDVVVIRSGPLNTPLEVTWNLVPDGTTPDHDYVAATGTVEFAVGADQGTISLKLIDDPTPETDEALLVVLNPAQATATPYASARVTLADDDTPIRTVVAEAGLHSDFLSTTRGPFSLQFLEGRLYWNGPSERRLLSWGPGDQMPRTEASSFGIPVAVGISGPYLIRLEASSGGNGNCAGFGVNGELVRTTHDGLNRLVLARLRLCDGSSAAPVASPSSVFFVESDTSPNRFHLRRIPINGGTPQTLLTVDYPIRSLLVAGPYLWCTEEDFPSPDTERHSVLWRVAVDGSGAEEWVTGLRNPRGRLLRDAQFLYLADNSFGGQERLLRISPVNRSLQVLWETDDYANRNDFLDLVLASGRLCWLNNESLQALPTTGGSPRTLVADINYPGYLAAGPDWIAWSEGFLQGQLRRHHLTSGAVSVDAKPVRRPGPLVHSNGTLWYSTGTRDLAEDGDSEIRSLTLKGGSNVAVAGGFTVQQPIFATGGSQIYGADIQAIKRLDANSPAPAIVHVDSSRLVALTASETSIYWATEALGEIRAVNPDGSNLRHITTAAGRPINLQVQGDHLFWIDDPSDLRSVPVTGGPPSDLITGMGAISNFLTDSSHVFAALQDTGKLVRVPLSGGPPSVLTSLSTFATTALAQTETRLFWSSDSEILSISKDGGSPLVVVRALPEPPAALATSSTHVYWIEPDSNRIRSAPLTP